MSYDRHDWEQDRLSADREALADFRAEERRRASDDVFNAAGDLGLLDDGADELTPVLLLSIAQWLIAAARKSGAVMADPGRAKLQRAFDALTEVDEEAAKAEKQARSYPRIPGVLHARDGFAVLMCGLPYERGVTATPNPTGVNSLGRLSSTPRENCPGCRRAIERHAELCAGVRR